jgi:hypothetical protein
MRLPINPDTLVSEFKSSIEILQKWVHAVETDGIPCIDMPGDETVLDEFLTELCGETRLVSQKLDSIAEILGDSERQ